MAIRDVLGGLVAMVVLGGCGGGGAVSGGYASYAPRAPTGGAGSESVSARSEAPSPASPESAPASKSEAPSAGGWDEGGRRETFNPAPERPGLGTGWGETRASRVHEVAFDRDGTTPFATGVLFYNDPQGVQALAAYHQAVSGGFFHDVPEAGGAITVSIVGANGLPLDALKVGGRTYVIGHEGERYSIVMTNHTNHRFESVATVDGLDVINGQPAALDDRGYILAPFGHLEIDGFRRSTDAVATFRFSRVSQSYAAQTSGDRNVGVIGVAFFSERGDSFTPWTFDELRTRDTASPFPADLRFAQPPR